MGGYSGMQSQLALAENRRRSSILVVQDGPADAEIDARIEGLLPSLNDRCHLARPSQRR